MEFTVTYKLLKVAEDACGLLDELTKCSHILPKCLKSRSLHSAGVLLGRVNVIVYLTGLFDLEIEAAAAGGVQKGEIYRNID